MIAKFALLSIVVAVALAEEDPFTGHCAISCQSVKSRHARSIDLEATDNQMPPSFVDQVIRRYSTYPSCMNDCMCAAYCMVLEELADWPLESCAPICRRAKPYSTGDKFFKQMEESISSMLQ